jgi:hypothetical protein
MDEDEKHCITCGFEFCGPIDALGYAEDLTFLENGMGPYCEKCARDWEHRDQLETE